MRILQEWQSTIEGVQYPFKNRVGDQLYLPLKTWQIGDVVCLPTTKVCQTFNFYQEKMELTFSKRKVDSGWLFDTFKKDEEQFCYIVGQKNYYEFILSCPDAILRNGMTGDYFSEASLVEYKLPLVHKSLLHEQLFRYLQVHRRLDSLEDLYNWNDFNRFKEVKIKI